MSPEPSRVRITGPLAGFADGFREQLAGWGYAKSSAAAQLRVMAHLSRWLDEQQLDAGGLTPEVVERFAAARRAQGRSNHASVRALDRLVEHLREVGAAPAVAPVEARTPAEELLARYRVYLQEERGLADATVDRCVLIAHRFLSWLDDTGAVDAQRLTADAVHGFMAAECAGRTAGSACNVASSLRSLLRYLHVTEVSALPLAQAVLGGPARREGGLPGMLDAGVVERLLASCDRRRAVGRRDVAILTLLARLGLRAGEVAGLKLDDVDWRRGQMLVAGKGGRCELLPLPVDVGEALAGYLRRGRPSTVNRRLFVRARAPYRGLAVSTISAVVYRACDRAGLPRVGAHRLRHAAATRMLHQGASLSEIGQLLRHRGVQVTGRYAKVDHRALEALAHPWPGGVA